MMTLVECKMSSYSYAVATLIFLMLPVCLMEISIETERHIFRTGELIIFHFESAGAAEEMTTYL